MTNEQKAALAAVEMVRHSFEHRLEGPMAMLLATLQRGHFQAAQDMIPDITNGAITFRAEVSNFEEALRAEKKPDVPVEVPADPQASSPAAPPAQPSVPAG
jgi:hypothetical protein